MTQEPGTDRERAERGLYSATMVLIRNKEGEPPFTVSQICVELLTWLHAHSFKQDMPRQDIADIVAEVFFDWKNKCLDAQSTLSLIQNTDGSYSVSHNGAEQRAYRETLLGPLTDEQYTAYVTTTQDIP